MSLAYLPDEDVRLTVSACIKLMIQSKLLSNDTIKRYFLLQYFHLFKYLGNAGIPALCKVLQCMSNSLVYTLLTPPPLSLQYFLFLISIFGNYSNYCLMSISNLQLSLLLLFIIKKDETFPDQNWLPVYSFWVPECIINIMWCC